MRLALDHDSRHPPAHDREQAALGEEAVSEKTNDPKPWRCVDFRWTSNHEPLGAPCRSATQSYHNCQFDPRPEFDVEEVKG
jgi:hypothetical protein